MRYLTVILFISTVLACTKKKNTGKCPITCNSAGVIAVFSGYTPSETDTVYLKTYKFNGAFDSLKSELQMSQTDTNNQIPPSSKYLGHVSLGPRTDYEIIIPATAQTFRIHMKDTIVVDTVMCDHMPKGGCFQPFLGASVTGGTIKYMSTGPSSYYLILEK
ncbi:MAG: hypothetical protein K0Q79_1416 [Flavipsychrobacter sp.]|jgi:hypothetical protein|nr:hypothetical protein [Flavipsychrobacter sp.]